MRTTYEAKYRKVRALLETDATLRGKIVSDIDVRSIGLPGDEDQPLGDALDDLAERVEQTVSKLKGEALEDEMVIEQAVNRALKKASQRFWDRRPIVETVILRL